MRIRDISVGGGAPLVLISGLNVLESLDVALACADGVAAIAERHGLPAVFKASYDKANGSSRDSFRGVGLDAGLRILERVKACAETSLPIHIKKGQFLAPADVAHAVEKAKGFGAGGVMVTERGTPFGY